MVTQDWSEQIILVELTDDPEFTDELNTLYERLEKNTKKNIVLNFSQVKFMNSSNISLLLKVRKILTDNNRKLLLCEISVQVWGVFLLTGLDAIFNVAEDTPSALAALQM